MTATKQSQANPWNRVCPQELFKGLIWWGFHYWLDGDGAGSLTDLSVIPVTLLFILPCGKISQSDCPKESAFLKSDPVSEGMSEIH